MAVSKWGPRSTGTWPVALCGALGLTKCRLSRDRSHVLGYDIHPGWWRQIQSCHLMAVSTVAYKYSICYNCTPLHFHSLWSSKYRLPSSKRPIDGSTWRPKVFQPFHCCPCRALGNARSFQDPPQVLSLCPLLIFWGQATQGYSNSALVLYTCRSINSNMNCIHLLHFRALAIHYTAKALLCPFPRSRAFYFVHYHMPFVLGMKANLLSLRNPWKC